MLKRRTTRVSNRLISITSCFNNSPRLQLISPDVSGSLAFSLEEYPARVSRGLISDLPGAKTVTSTSYVSSRCKIITNQNYIHRNYKLIMPTHMCCLSTQFIRKKKTVPYASSTSSDQLYFFTATTAGAPGVSCKKAFKARVLPFDFLPFLPIIRKKYVQYITI